MLVHLVDSHVYIFRAYVSLPEMHAPDGTPTHAAYGFANTLLRMLAEFEASHFVCAFDHAMTSFRNELEPGYKAGRTEPPEDLEPQFALCVEVAEALGLPAISAPGFEADDVVATLAEGVLAGGADVQVVSSDKDLAQLVREDGRVRLLDFARERLLDAPAVRTKFGVDPEQIPDYLGLVGDAVDNLPGVPGVGSKSAAAVLGAFRRIEDVPADADAWPEVAVRGVARLAARIEQHRERALRTRDLATVRRDVPELPDRIEAFARRGVDHPRARALCQRLGWGAIADRIARLD